MAHTDADTEKETAPPAEVKPRPGRIASLFERAPERLPETEEVVERPRHEKPQESDPEVFFEPVERQPYIISYVCVLIPRFDTHFLEGDVVAFLKEWMQNLCISHSWKLDWTDIHSTYFQWMVSVPVTVSPAQFIRILRYTTSANILRDFPHYTRENTSRDFWAPGHMLAVGRRAIPVAKISEFISMTRQQQGIYPSHPR